MRVAAFSLGICLALFLVLAGCKRPRATAPEKGEPGTQPVVVVAKADTPPARPVDAVGPKLAVVVVFDQMRFDYPTRWKEFYGEAGFKRLAREGATFENCRYPYAATMTGPGHASILAGGGPEIHGIVSNEWFDPAQGTEVYCAASTRYTRVPNREIVRPKNERFYGMGNPDNLAAPSVGDVLKATHKERGRVFGLSLKDRSALLPLGKRPDGAYWQDAGEIVTSSYYRDALPGWVKRFNDDKFADQWAGKSWEKLSKAIDYAKSSGPDDGPGEGGRGLGPLFPHPLGKDGKVDVNYYNAVYNSPFGNEILLELAKRAISAEKLGQRDSVDLLVVSFSSNDAIGHVWGPDSQEVMDVTLRSDQVIAALMKHLDEQVGRGHYTLVMTADHGICPIPEGTIASGKEAGRLNVAEVVRKAERRLDKKFGPAKDPATGKGQWIRAVAYPWIHLDGKTAEARKVDPAAVADELVDFLGDQPGIEVAYTRKQVEAADEGKDPYLTAMKHSYFAPRSGDVGFVMKPYYLFGSTSLTGTTHGSPHDYDCHVPLFVVGPGVVPGVKVEAVTPCHVAAIVAHALGIDPPAKALYPVPDGLFGN